MKKLFCIFLFVILFTGNLFAQIDSNNRKLDIYLRSVVNDYQVATLYAYQLGVLTAARAAQGVTNKWEGVDVIPLADSDEIHAIWYVPHNANTKYSIYLRWQLVVGNADSAASTLTTTVDKINMTRTAEGSDTAADGATALTTTIPAITIAETETENFPFASDWGKIVGSATLFDALFVKLVSSSNTAADRLRVVALQIAYKRAKRAAHYQ